MSQRLVVPEMVTVPICICRLYIHTHTRVCVHAYVVCVCANVYSMHMSMYLSLVMWWGDDTRHRTIYIYVYIYIGIYIYIYLSATMHNPWIYPRITGTAWEPSPSVPMEGHPNLRCQERPRLFFPTMANLVHIVFYALAAQSRSSAI